MPCVPKASGEVPVSLWHRVLGKSPSSMWSPAWWSLGIFLPAGIFRNQGFLSNGGRSLPSTKIIKCEIPLTGKRIQILGLEKEMGGSGKEWQISIFLSSDLDQSLVCYIVTGQVGWMNQRCLSTSSVTLRYEGQFLSTLVWASSGSWWRTGKPAVLQSMGLQRVGHDWVTELNICISLYMHFAGKSIYKVDQFKCDPHKSLLSTSLDTKL